MFLLNSIILLGLITLFRLSLNFWLNTLICRANRRPVGILHVKLIKAMNLKKKDLLGASDPYVKLKLTESKVQSRKSSVKHKNLNPEWNEDYNFVIKDPESQALELVVYDWEKVYYSKSLLISCSLITCCVTCFSSFLRLANMKRWV